MRNQTIERVIEEIVSATNYNPSFKRSFTTYIKNCFDNNVGEGDFENALSKLKVEEIDNENDN